MDYSDFKLFYGDLHAHSNISTCGVCIGRKLSHRDLYFHSSLIKDYLESLLDDKISLDNLYIFAKDTSGLDFVAVTDHDFTMSDEVWSFVQRKAWEWYKPGEFVTFSAYEWTSYLYGHRNIYFINDDAPLFRCVREEDGKKIHVSPRELWSFLRKRKIRAITIPHHPSLTQFPVDWDYYDSEFDRAVEIASIWGIFERFGNPFQCMTSDNLPRYFVYDALEKGYRLGIVGGSDSHDCRPGDKLRPVYIKNLYKELDMNSLSNIFVPYFVYNPLGAGLTVVYSRSLNREDIFNAIYERRIYAVIGERVVLRFYVDEHIMGEEIHIVDAEYRPRIRVEVESPELIDRVEVLRNGDVIFSRICLEKVCYIDFVDEGFKPFRRTNYYYARVILRNGARAWSSPIWVVYDGPREIDLSVYNRSTGSIQHINFLVSRASFALVKDLRYGKKCILEEILSKIEYGSVICHEKIGIDESLIKLRFKHSGRANWRGYLKLNGYSYYNVKPYRFAIIKYGGDLFVDDYKGIIRWDITTGSNLNELDKASVKGLDILIRYNPFMDVYGVFNVLYNGKTDISHTFIQEEKTLEIPAKIVINEPIGKNMPLSELYDIKELNVRYLVIYPGKIDEQGLRAKVFELSK